MIMHGGVAPAGWDVPAITGLVQDLSARFDITVYAGLTPGGRHDPSECSTFSVRYIQSHNGSAPKRFALLAMRAFLKDHSMRPFSLVHGLWGLPGGLAAVLAGKRVGIPSVVSLLGGEAASLPDIRYGNMRTFAARTLTLYAARQAGDLVFLTGYQLDHLRRYGFTRTDGVHIIPMGADPAAFPYVAERPASPPYHLLHVGHLNGVKDQRTLLMAFRDISKRVDSRLRIIGEGVLEDELRTLARRLEVSDRVSFAGFIPHDKLRPHFDWAHLLIHSSLYEGEGVVIAEAAAAGVPVCGTRVGLLADPGFSFALTSDPGDHEALARAACLLLQDDEKRKSLSDAARAWAVEHTAEWTASRYAELYSRRIDRPATVTPNRRTDIAYRQSTIIPGGPLHPEFVCPSCHRTLTAVRDGWSCTEEQITFQTENGIQSFLLPRCREELLAFLETYQQIRKKEDWGEASTEYFRGLPYRDRSQKHARVWGIRARTFDRFLRHFSGQERDHKALVLDIGAGNCWFASRIAALGHSVIALDINIDPLDGLGALGRYPREQASRIMPVRADFDAAPFRPSTFDVAVFNASLHYFPDVIGTISRAMNLLRDRGVLYIMDTPVYRNPDSGLEMLRERRRTLASLVTDPPGGRIGSFLTHSMLRNIQKMYRTEVLVPRYGVRWNLRPALARLLGKREPASFMIVVVQKD